MTGTCAVCLWRQPKPPAFGCSRLNLGTSSRVEDVRQKHSGCTRIQAPGTRIKAPSPSPCSASVPQSLRHEVAPMASIPLPRPLDRAAAAGPATSRLSNGCPTCAPLRQRSASPALLGAGSRSRACARAVAATTQAVPIPMRSTEPKNLSPVEDIRKLTVITAIKTPYLPDGRFDLEAFDQLVHLQIQSGAEGIIVGGTTGEGQLMSWDEHIMLIAHTVNCFGDRIKVVGNTGSNSTREAIHATEQGFAVGMHAALHINPYYGKTSHEGLLAHFSSVLPMGPAILYNVPGRTGQDIPPSIVEALAAQFPTLAGVKECMGHERVGLYARQGITVWSGNDDECHDSKWDHGAQGVISVMSNLVPGLTKELLTGAAKPELDAALAPLVAWLFAEPNPIGLNTALSQLGLIRPVFRLPYVPLGLERRQEFVDIVHALGIEHFVGAKDVKVLQDSDFLLIGRY